MSVPVVPSTLPHPLGRKPLSGSLPLPWSNCHHSAFASIEVRTRSAWTNAPSQWNYDDDEMVRFHNLQRLDLERSRAAREAAAAGLPPLPPPPPHQESDQQNCGFEPIVVDPDFPREIYYRCQFPGVHGPMELEEKMYARTRGSPCSCDQCISSRAERRDFGDLIANSEPGPDRDLAMALLGMMLTQGSSEDMPSTVINVSYDLAEVAEVNDPRDFFKELEILNEYVEFCRFLPCLITLTG